MDEISTGSTISKEAIKYTYLDNGVINVEDIVIETIKQEKQDEVKEMTIDDFINDFKI
mgnify:CR=1 FL=1